MVYYLIFFTNVLRVLDEQRITKHQLSERSGVSLSFISDITTGKGNPSINTMEKIAAALDMPLPFLLEWTDLPTDQIARLAIGQFRGSLPPGYKRVSLVLPDYEAFMATTWAEKVRKEWRR